MDYERPYHASNDPVITGHDTGYYVIDANANVVKEAGSFESQAEAHNWIRDKFHLHWMKRRAF